MLQAKDTADEACSVNHSASVEDPSSMKTEGEDKYCRYESANYLHETTV